MNNYRKGSIVAQAMLTAVCVQSAHGVCYGIV